MILKTVKKKDFVALVIERKSHEKIIIKHKSGDELELEIQRIQKGTYGGGMVWIAFIDDEFNFKINRDDYWKENGNK